jgi:transcriptional regulator with XRE-family HTH domain
MKSMVDLLTERREQKGISLTELSAMTGIKEPHLLRIEQGDTKPNMPIVFRICKALDMDPLELFDLLGVEFRQAMDKLKMAQ